MRSDRGAEFKNALMAELSVMLGAEWRFSAPLRPCELGANERVHQEVQKVLGAVVRQVGSTVGDTWSDWLVVAEYVIDNTPGPHGYTPRIWSGVGHSLSLLRGMFCERPSSSSPSLSGLAASSNSSLSCLRPLRRTGTRAQLRGLSWPTGTGAHGRPEAG